MAQKYLSDFYTFQAKPVGIGPIFADPSTPLEQQIHAYVLAGNQQYYAGNFASALTNVKLGSDHGIRMNK